MKWSAFAPEDHGVTEEVKKGKGAELVTDHETSTAGRHENGLAGSTELLAAAHITVSER